MHKNLILLTHKFPDNKSEVFLWNELEYMNYDKVYIISMTKSDYVYIPDNSKFLTYSCGNTLKFPKGILWVILSLIRKEFWIELLKLISLKKLNLESFLNLIKTTAYGERLFYNAKGFIPFKNKNEKFIIYSYWLTSTAYAAIRLKNKYKNCIYSFSRCHGHDIYTFRYSYDYIVYQEFFIRNLNEVSSISQNGKEYLIENIGYNICKNITVSRLGTNNYGTQKYNRKVFTIISCSSIVKLKRIERIIDCLAEIDSMKLNWIHFGSGPLEAKIKKYCQEKLDNKNNISYEFYGYIKNDDLMKIYANSYFDLFLNVSESEGIPVSIMEALSFGIPVIATDVGGCAEIVDEKCGYIIPSNFTNDDLIDKIRNIYNMKNSEYLLMRINARKKWNENFNSQKNYTNLHNHLKSMFTYYKEV